MRRREFMTLLGGATAAWPLAARAQQPAMPVIGFLSGGSAPGSAVSMAAFRLGLKEIGFAEGQNVTIEYRWADGQVDRLPAMAADLVRRRVNVLVPVNFPAAQAAKAATAAIPIVFQMGVDPVKFGFVASLNRPGGNITGASSLNVELGPKLLELLHEMVPAATDIALLVNPTNPNSETLSRDALAAAGTLGLKLHVLHASADGDLETVFATLAQLRAGGLVITTNAFFGNRYRQLAALALRHAVPAISARGFAAAGGLMDYGSSDQLRQIGVYVGRILKGEKPGDLPVQQATKIELIINLNTAKALGLTFPITLLGRADEVIE